MASSRGWPWWVPRTGWMLLGVVYRRPWRPLDRMTPRQRQRWDRRRHTVTVRMGHPDYPHPLFIRTIEEADAVPWTLLRRSGSPFWERKK